MADVSEEDMERLASRLAMLVSEDGEAESAGRAVAHLARRIGMTGGQLKEMFLGGAGGRVTVVPSARTLDSDRMERELAALRRGNRQLESDLRNTERERDALVGEVESMRGALFRAQTVSHAQRIIGGIVLIALAVAAAVGYVVPLGRSVTPSGPPVVQAPKEASNKDTPSGAHYGTVRKARTLVYAEPDQNSRVLASLTPGTALVVHRVLWNMLEQWAEVEVGSGTGYVLTTDIDLS